MLMGDFHEEFNVTKQVGVGSFARVYYAKRIETGEEYAVKAFSKKAINAEDKGL